MEENGGKVRESAERGKSGGKRRRRKESEKQVKGRRKAYVHGLPFVASVFLC